MVTAWGAPSAHAVANSVVGRFVHDGYGVKSLQDFLSKKYWNRVLALALLYGKISHFPKWGRFILTLGVRCTCEVFVLVLVC